MKKYIVLFIVSMGFISCKKYLDVKPDKTLIVPATLLDCQAILSNFEVMNNQFPSDGEASGDNYYLSDTDFGTLFSQEDRDMYLWKSKAQHLNSNWSFPYQVVFYSNIVLQTLDKIKPATSEQTRWNTLKGTALFFRSYAFFCLSQLYAKQYSSSANNELGIPLRLDPNINLKTERATLAQTYDRILQDLTLSTELLPVNSRDKSHPNKSAGFAMLARVYLSMEKYQEAGSSANSSLALYNSLLDYNDLDSNSMNPIGIFNSEVIFHSRTSGSTALLNSSLSKIDLQLYNSYNKDDLRRVIFFSTNSDKSHAFKGDYGGDGASPQFNGLAVDEMYLVRAECFARANNTTSALTDLNTLMSKRWRKDKFVPFTAPDAETALKLILNERRKELIFRHQRWTDLRRLNNDTRFAKTLTRVMNGQTYSLPQNDPRYVIMIPQNVIDETGIQQNQ